MVSEASMSSNHWSVVSELFVPRNYEDYCDFMEARMIELEGYFLIPWPVEGGFEYWIHEEDVVDSLTSNFSFVSDVVPEASIYAEKDAEKEEGDQSMDIELQDITCENLDPSQLLILNHREELDEKSSKLTDSISSCEFSTSVVYIFKSTDKYENQQVCVNKIVSKKIDEMLSAHDMFAEMSERDILSSWFPFDPGIHLVLDGANVFLSLNTLGSGDGSANVFLSLLLWNLLDMLRKHRIWELCECFVCNPKYTMAELHLSKLQDGRIDGHIDFVSENSEWVIAGIHDYYYRVLEVINTDTLKLSARLIAIKLGILILNIQATETYKCVVNIGTSCRIIGVWAHRI